MENEKKSTQNPQRDQHAATPISTVETRLAIFAHDGLTLPADGKAQIQPNLATHLADFIIAAERGPRHACPTIE